MVSAEHRYSDRARELKASAERHTAESYSLDEKFAAKRDRLQKELKVFQIWSVFATAVLFVGLVGLPVAGFIISDSFGEFAVSYIKVPPPVVSAAAIIAAAVVGSLVIVMAGALLAFRGCQLRGSEARLSSINVMLKDSALSIERIAEMRRRENNANAVSSAVDEVERAVLHR